jgi:hypothetical protein
MSRIPSKSGDFHFDRKYLRSSPPMYLIVISQCPQTALTIGYSFLPLSPLNATPKYWPSTTKLSVPSSISNTTKNLSGTMKVSSGFNKVGYVTPGQFFTSWYNLLRPEKPPFRITLDKIQKQNCTSKIVPHKKASCACTASRTSRF